MKRYVIAEIGSNFDQKKSKVFKMINEAKKCGADAVKFQLFKASLLYCWLESSIFWGLTIKNYIF